ncbi:MAG: D-alanyl-D-alanine carboxypeptidase/D-alanyl-D-alanine-endopeptidase [Candidatus Nanopelagicales bacterium]
MTARRSLTAAAAATASLFALAAPASAKVPPWPTVAAAMPSGLWRPATTSTPDYLSRMRTRLERRVGAAALGSHVSVRVEDLASGAALYSHDADTARVPASTMKTATALAVLSAAGPGHRMPTRVMRSPDNSTLTLVGGGDPLLSSDDLDRLAATVAGRLQDEGRAGTRFLVRYDDSLFAPATLPAGWYSSYFPDYSAVPSALSRDLRSVSAPAKDAARYFRSRLKEHGLRPAGGTARATAAAHSTRVARLRGHSIAEAIWPMLQYSDNSIAENLIRHVALARHTATTAGGAAAAVRAELGTMGVPTIGTRFVDGSGLSRRDRLTATALVAITRAAVDPRDPRLATGFRTSAFPLAGVSGTLSSRFDAKATRCAQGRIMAKTGSLSDTMALSGVASATDGRLRAFSILVNHKPSWSSWNAALYRVDRIATAITGCH